MKKLSLVLAALVVASTMALANDVAWKINFGMFTHDASDLTNPDKDGILTQYDVLWQLIYAGPNNAIDPIDLTTDGFVSGDDEVLGSRLLSSGNSGIFDDTLYTEDTAGTVTTLSYVYSEDNPYYVYQRIYESQQPEAGTYYYESELKKLDSDYDFGSQTISLGPDESGLQSTLQVQGPASVPEPATMSLLGLGALAMVLRRKLRK